MVQKYINDFQKNVGETVNVLCHRHPNRFWKMLLRQGVNFSKIDTKIIWAGEPGADGGGLYREFLLYAITNLENSNLLFGKPPNCFFTGYADAILKNIYRALGQISALGILFINHGPECLHNALVNKLFGISDTFELEDLHSFDGELERKIEELKVRNNECLLEANIMPTNHIQENIPKFCNYYCLFSREAAIEQFRKGVASICSSIIEKPCCFKKYFAQNQTNTTLEELRVNLNFARSTEGTNAYEKEEDALIEFELFLLSMESPNSDVTVKDFLQFCTAMDRIPVMGFTKPIEVFFTHENKYPKVSTCGLTLTLRYNVSTDMLIYSVKNGGTFGDH